MRSPIVVAINLSSIPVILNRSTKILNAELSLYTTIEKIMEELTITRKNTGK
ncbi:MAG TPA: hypothetical protein VKA95_13845 [Nitrososphaeraceae archaeon]|nr:hypothetical protein [Nitrososphaeraceae archaeon]